MKDFFAELKRRNVIRVAVFYGAAGWLILQIGDVVLDIVGAPDGSLRLVATILALGFPFAMILAWAFEITPEGIKREHQVDRSNDALSRAGRKLDVATIALLLLAIVLFAWVNFRAPATPVPGVAEQTAPATAQVFDGPRDLSIAVLPFVNMSTDPENEYFSDGLSEELLNVLARIEDFHVAGRTSSFAFKGQNHDLRAIGERLSVANILEGSVRKQGDRIRVTAQLIDARNGFHLWSDTYDRRLDDVFAIQDEIATEVVKALRQTLLAADEIVIAQTAKGDVEAYNFYLRGQYHVRLRTRAGLERALEEFQQAIVIDPDYAPPYAGIAMVYALLDNYNYRSLSETEQLAYRALDRALALDPQSDEAWAVRGLLLGQGAGALQRRAEAREALERAVEINPNNALAQLWLAVTKFPDSEAVRASLQRAYELDPLSPVIIYRQAMEALQRRDQARLDRYLGELEQVAPDWFMTWNAAGSVALEQGRIADSALALERAVALNPEYAGTIGLLAGTLEMLGYQERALHMLEDSAHRVGGELLELMLAAARTRAVLLAHDFAAALAIYRPAVESLDKATAQEQADLAMLELSAGEAEAAERRMRAALGIGPDELARTNCRCTRTPRTCSSIWCLPARCRRRARRAPRRPPSRPAACWRSSQRKASRSATCRSPPATWTTSTARPAPWRPACKNLCAWDFAHRLRT
jgi:TolB-like protein/Tfp pilus assembly protein PilF